jgi:hypothetical protein
MNKRLLFSAVSLSILLFPYVSLAGDTLWHLTSGKQDVLALIEVTSVTDTEANATPIFFFPQSHKHPKQLTILQERNRITERTLVAGKRYLASLQAKDKEFVPKWGVYEITGSSTDDAEISRASEGGDWIAMQHFIRTKGRDSTFAFDSGRVYTVRDGVDIQIYPPNASLEIPKQGLRRFLEELQLLFTRLQRAIF